MLAGGSRGRDADDLARPALEQENVAQADVVAGDRDSVGSVVATARAGATGAAARDSALRDLDGLTVVFVVTHFGGGGGVVVVVGLAGTGDLYGLLDVNVLAENWTLVLVVMVVVVVLVLGLVDGGPGVGLLFVLGLATGTVLALDVVNGRDVRAVGAVDLDASVLEGSRGGSVLRVCVDALLVAVLLVTVTGTAVILFTADTDLLFVTMLLVTNGTIGSVDSDI